MRDEHTGDQYAQIETLFLDIGGTLISIDFEWVAAEIEARGFACTIDSLRRAEAAAKPEISRLLHGDQRSPGPDAFYICLRAMLARLSSVAAIASPQRIEALACELSGVLDVPGQANRLWRSLMPGVLEALEAFQELKLQLVAVSNSDGSAEQGLQDVGLRPYFSLVVDSTLVGFEKPDPRIFEHALRESGAERSRTLHVGDLYHADVVGAHRAGILAILLDPYYDWVGVDCERISDLGDLVSLLRAQQGPRQGKKF